MLTNTIMTTAALRSRSLAPFGVDAGVATKQDRPPRGVPR
jgi:hypothetical protein